MKFMKLGSRPDSFQKDGNNIRFVATELDYDVAVNVGDVKFYLHKFPLLSKCGRLQKMVTTTKDETIEEINMPDIPGSATAFEICAKFCYGMTVTLNAYNVIAARCAAEYLEMHESMEKGNIIYKIEVFLKASIFHSWKDSIIVLQTTKSFLPWSEDLKLVGHCIDSIASKATIDTSVVDWSYTYNKKKLASEAGIEQQWNGVVKQQSVPKDWWVEDISELELDSYKRVILAIKSKGRISDEVIGESLKAYMYKWLPGFGKGSMIHKADVAKSRLLLETITWLLPKAKGSVSCSFLLKLLRLANLLDIGQMCKKDLIKRTGRQLEEACVTDLLIPAPEGEVTKYDIETVLSVVEEFLMQGAPHSQTRPLGTNALNETSSNASNGKLAVAKLVDGYLTEVSKDPKFPLSKFIDFTEMVLADSRPVHDALYHAIDMYLKEHPAMSKCDKKKICSLMDCRKLSLDASVHAVQNERLPLRVVVQVLFFEQVRASATGNAADLPVRLQTLLPRESGGSYGSSRSCVTTNTEDEWDVVPRVEDVKPTASAKLGGPGRASRRSSGSIDGRKNSKEKDGNKQKETAMPRKMLSKLWTSKGQGGENSGSDTSESPVEELKSRLSRNMSYSVS